MEKLAIESQGIWNVIDDPATMVAISKELDFVIIDLEHGFRDFSRFTSGYLSLRHSTSTFVRPRSFRDPWLQSFLDVGITKFVVPQLESLANLEEFLENILYYPEGTRGVHPKAASFKLPDDSSRFEVVPIVETVDILSNLDAVLQYEEVTGIYFGSYDLSLRLGLPSPVCQQINEYMHQVIEAANTFQKDFFYMPLNDEQLEFSQSALYPNVVLGIDLEILANSIQIQLRKN